MLFIAHEWWYLWIYTDVCLIIATSTEGCVSIVYAPRAVQTRLEFIDKKEKSKF